VAVPKSCRAAPNTWIAVTGQAGESESVNRGPGVKGFNYWSRSREYLNFSVSTRREPD
jgi:hypothetical protein